MSAAISNTGTQQIGRIHTARPSFFGIVRGELLKISRLKLTWIMLVILTGGIMLMQLLMLRDNLAETLSKEPLAFLFQEVRFSMEVLRIFGGLLLLVLTAYIIGLEFQYGTIRIVLSRGVGRVQLLLGKLFAIVLFALTMLIGGLLLNALIALIFIGATTGNFNALKAMDATFWSKSGLYLLYLLTNTGITILLATALSVVGRSLAFALSLTLMWFPMDNMGTLIMFVLKSLTHNDFWANITAYFLGPNLNVMGGLLIKSQTNIGAPPLVQIDATHTFWVTLGYAVVFTIVAIVVTWKRDIKE
jgi:ABC-2 type transport system permease protein